MVPHGFGVSMEKEIAETPEQRKSNAYAVSEQWGRVFE
jgi:hypothetical protein